MLHWVKGIIRNGGYLIIDELENHFHKRLVQFIIDLFNDPEIGCLTGRPIPVENKKNKYGYWANFLFEAAHRIRKKSFLDYYLFYKTNHIILV